MDLQSYLELAKEYDSIALSKKFILDTITPISAVQTLMNKNEEFFLLESSSGQDNLGRYSFLGLKPFATFTSQDGSNTVTGRFNRQTTMSPFNALENFMNELKVYHGQSTPLSGGGAGFFSYDCVRYLEGIDLKTKDTPESIFLFPSILVCFDHLTHEVIVTIYTFPEEEVDKTFFDGMQELTDVCEKLTNTSKVVDLTRNRMQFIELPKEDGDFIEAVKKAQEEIAAGNIFQIVLSKEFNVPFKGDPFSVYRQLRAGNPSPYLFYFQFQDFCLLGSSPEMLVKKEADQVQTFPIAGTRKKTGHEKEDRQAMLELFADTKEKAEHVMLVDLGRNDLGKVCVPGSIKVKEFMSVQQYSHVMHLVSIVEGLCKKNITAIDVLKAVFPAGTVSGAPKIKAMQLIAQLEEIARGLYAGAVGYIDFNNNCDFCIAIRTMLIKGDVALLRAGAGIVADSVPEKEYLEILAKAQVLFQTLRGEAHVSNY